MQTNDEVVRATQASILAIGTALIDCIIIVEAVVTYIANSYRSMLLCTIELAVRGTLDIMIGIVQLVCLSSYYTAEISRLTTRSRIISPQHSTLSGVVSKMTLRRLIALSREPSLQSM
jgi:hypothetical protein